MSNARQPIKRPLCRDPKPMTRERILAIAQTRGWFEVSWRYRDDSLRKACRKMVHEGLLRRERGAPGADYFAIPRPPVARQQPRQETMPWD